jgi:prepilin-type processing-associated H-X9-DG protein
LRRVMLAAGKPDAGKPDWAAAWQEMSKGHAALMVDTVAFNRAVAQELKRAQGPQAMIGTFAPMWEQSKRLFAGIEVGNGVKIQATLDCPTPDAAERVRATAEAALTLARNMLDKLGEHIASTPGADQAGPALIFADLAATILKQAKLTADGNITRLQADAQIDVADTGIAALAPAIMAAREAAKRSQSMNNLKQIGLAFHNYHDVYGHFPAAAVIGPDGKTPHSWRVAILPYIEGTAIYNQYKFDEPWDSENNKKLIAQIPVVFRDPGADPAGNSSYYVLTGETTIFGPKDGAKIATITDGTSNTILAVEAKRDIPWTRPEDIAYDPAKPLPKLGGWRPNGFNTLFADGSVRFISDTINEMTLRALLTRAGGEPVPLP